MSPAQQDFLPTRSSGQVCVLCCKVEILPWSPLVYLRAVSSIHGPELVAALGLALNWADYELVQTLDGRENNCKVQAMERKHCILAAPWSIFNTCTPLLDDGKLLIKLGCVDKRSDRNDGDWMNADDERSSGKDAEIPTEANQTTGSRTFFSTLNLAQQPTSARPPKPSNHICNPKYRLLLAHLSRKFHDVLMTENRNMTYNAASIAIIGAGPCGLTFASLLETNNIDYVVFEKDIDSTPTPMHQGGTLDLHGPSAQQALRSAGLFEEFRKLARWDATKFVVQDPTCTLKAEFGQDRDAPEIDRCQLRQLLDSIPSHKVRWSHGVQAVDKGSDSGWIVKFTNGASASGFQLIVGADGAWSKLTMAKPEYSGKMFIETRLSHDNPSYSAALELSGLGNMMASGHGRTVSVQQVSDRSYRVYVGLVAPENLTRTTLDMADTEATPQKLLSSPEFFADFAPELRSFISDAEGPFRLWPLYRMPVSSVKWGRVPGVTLLGDAAHVSTPFLGEGVNMAMYDALKLAESIINHRDTSSNEEGKDASKLEEAVKEYETEMFGHAQDFIKRCIMSEEIFFAEDGAQQFIDTISHAVEIQQEQLFVDGDWIGPTQDFTSMLSWHPSFNIRTHSPDVVIKMITIAVAGGTRGIGRAIAEAINRKGGYRVKILSTSNIIVVDIEHNRAAIPGQGDTPVTFTHTLDVAEFVELPTWEKESYVIGENVTWNEFLRIAEEVKGVKFEVTHDEIDFLKSGKITELPSHPSLYSVMPKDQLQTLFATFGIWFEEGLYHLQPKMTHNQLFPRIKARTVKEFEDLLA
ncbi:hypothetical protein CSAL01_07590 [Colletotrichum salicis]|uniref:FAD-binding domain-containing protein n=1 Tax=Colletotrichum salicis TaxID=1209931 RepID=A0A135S525_9PEZI|nr:hypothetical protein CSAL01_07590 [Colletotrichum salicis]